MIGLDEDSMYSLLFIFFLSYCMRGKMYPILTKMYNDYNFFKLFSAIMSSQVINIEDNDTSNSNSNRNSDNIVKKIEPKYEDKFLDDIRKMTNAYIFDEKEEELYCNKSAELFLLAQEEDKKKVIEHKDKIADIGKQIKIYESEEEFCNIKYNENDKDSIEDKEDYIEHSIEHSLNKGAIERLTDEKVELEKILHELLNNERNMDELRLETQAKARQFVIDERLDKLKNSFVMEKTPLGNVLMLYNNKRGSFEFYSDNTIPYRYLEPVSRKYVKMFNCRPIYFDMEEELNNYEKKLEEKRILEEEEKRLLEEDQKKKENRLEPPPKKKVFAKFKSYNKEAGTGHVNIGAPPKNSIPNTKVTENNTNEKVLLKENANRYSYEGKLSNFNFLKKVDRKVVDKKYGMTFADFKRLQEEKMNKVINKV
jgi:hypothetical protein